MQSRGSRKILPLRVAIDMAMICVAWIAAYYARFSLGLATPQGIPEPSLYFKLLPFIVLIWIMVFLVTGFYSRTGQHRSAFIEGLDVVQCSVVGILAFIAFTYFYEEYRYSRLVLIFFAILQPMLVITGRSWVRKILRYRTSISEPRKVLIIGSGENLANALNLARSDLYQKIVIHGAMLAIHGRPSEEDQEFCRRHALRVFDVPSDWSKFLADNPVQSVYFALAHKDYGFLENHLPQVADQVPDVKLLPDILRYAKFSAGIEMVRGIPVVSIHESPLVGSGATLKRAMDILGGAIGLILCSPVMLVLSIFIPLTSKGPILYRQKRMGLDGKVFDCLKFRSMPIDSEDKTGPVWATADDNRPTALGRIMRKFSLDELPQLLNVLKGDMSLVGPRPERPVFVNQFRQSVPGYMLRHKVKAGITGWAQVNGWRGNTSIEKRIECDLYYIQNWSLWLDIKIILMTIEEMCFGKNAY